MRLRLDALAAAVAASTAPGTDGLRQRTAGTSAAAAGAEAMTPAAAGTKVAASDAPPLKTSGFPLWQLLLVALIMFLVGRLISAWA